MTNNKTKLLKLQLSGVRAFDCASNSNNDKNNVAEIFFEDNLTLIVGKNGTGKTTVIEALKYLCTGDLPPNSKNGAFVHDPLLNKSLTSLAQLKLYFQSNNNKVYSVTKTLHCERKSSKIEQRTHESILLEENNYFQKNITDSNFKDLDYKENSISNNNNFNNNNINNNTKLVADKVSEVKNGVPFYLNTHPPILQNIIFCHQEDTAWPLGDTVTVKKKLDEIFNSTQYAKSLTILKTLKTEIDREINNNSNKLNYLLKEKLHKEELNNQIKSINDRIEKYIEEIKEYQRSKKVLEEELNGFNTKLIELSKQREEYNLYRKEIEEIERIKKEYKDNLIFVEYLNSDKNIIDGKIEEIKNEINKMNQNINSDENKEILNQYNQIKKQVENNKEERKKQEELKHSLFILENKEEAAEETKNMLKEDIIRVYQNYIESNNINIDQLNSYSNNFTDQYNSLIIQRNNLNNLIKENDFKEQKCKRAVKEYNTLRMDKDIMECMDENYNLLNNKNINDEIDQITTVMENLNSKSNKIGMEIKRREKAKEEYGYNMKELEYIENNSNIKDILPEEEYSKMFNDLKQYKAELEMKKEKNYLWSNKIEEATRSKETLSRKVTKIELEIEDIFKNKSNMEILQRYNKNINRNNYNTVIPLIELNNTDMSQKKYYILKTSHTLHSRIKEKHENEGKCGLCENEIINHKEFSNKYNNFFNVSDANTQFINNFNSKEQNTEDVKEFNRVAQEINEKIKERKDVIDEVNRVAEINLDELRMNIIFNNNDIMVLNDKINEITHLFTLNSIAQEEEKKNKEKVEELRMKIENYTREFDPQDEDILYKKYNKVKGVLVELEKKREHLERKMSNIRNNGDKISRYSTLSNYIKNNSENNSNNDEAKRELDALNNKINNLTNKYNEIEYIGKKKLKDYSTTLTTLYNITQSIAQIENIPILKFNYSDIQQQYERLSTQYNKIIAQQQKHSKSINKLQYYLYALEKIRFIRNSNVNIKKHNNYNEEEFNTVSAAITTNNTNLSKISSVINQTKGRLNELVSSKQNIKVQIEKYKDSSKIYNYCNILIYVLNQTLSDVIKSIKALEKSIVTYHNTKIEEVNIHLAKLWTTTYAGDDIEYIEIESTLSNSSYNYEVFQRVNGNKILLKGRCSAGQKIIASILIKVAILQTFNINNNILTLDEPTTSLDKNNSYKLAQTLRNLISKNVQFQLVVITHDEDFIKQFRVEKYYRVEKDSRNKSRISEENIYSGEMMK